MEKFELTCYRYKTVKEQEDTEDTRKTVDVKSVAEPYYIGALKANAGRRMVKLTFHEHFEFHIPARDLSLVIGALQFEVTDLRR